MILKIILKVTLIAVASSLQIDNCIENAKLIKSDNGTSICECSEGYFGDPYEKCIETQPDICKVILNKGLCGSLSECVVDAKKGPLCLCQPRTIGHPPNCKERCWSDNHCDDNKYCNIDTGICEIGCRLDRDCKNGEICDESTRTCIGGCRYDDNCKINEICVDRECIKGCQSDKNCNDDEYCIRSWNINKCEKGCKLYESCDLNEYCDKDNHECKHGCKQNSENCKFSEVCDLKTRNCTAACVDDSDCNLMETCSRDHICVMKIKECKSHQDCKNDEYCDQWNDKCVKGCRDNKNCENNQYCSNNHKCEIGCRSFNCKSGKCDDNCDLQEYCSYDHKCEKGCKSDKNCDDAEYCNYSHKCIKGCRLNHENCESGEYCFSQAKKCLKGCRSDVNCKDNEYCNDGKCIVGCRSHESCLDDEACDDRSKKCIKGCRNDDNCNDDEFCNNLEYCYYRPFYCEQDYQCKNVCEGSNCGEKSKCHGKNHKKLCTCIDGYLPIANIGCKPYNGSEISFTSDKKPLCFHFCAENSLCEVEENEIYCSCDFENYSNPFLKCIDVRVAAAGAGPSCDCCSDNLKPGCEYSIDPNLLKTLLG